MLLTKTCYYSENQAFRGVNNQGMSLIETCFCSRLYGMYYPLNLCSFCLRYTVLYNSFSGFFLQFHCHRHSYEEKLLLEKALLARKIKTKKVHQSQRLRHKITNDWYLLKCKPELKTATLGCYRVKFALNWRQQDGLIITGWRGCPPACLPAA